MGPARRGRLVAGVPTAECRLGITGTFTAAMSRAPSAHRTRVARKRPHAGITFSSQSYSLARDFGLAFARYSPRRRAPTDPPATPRGDESSRPDTRPGSGAPLFEHPTSMQSRMRSAKITLGGVSGSKTMNPRLRSAHDVTERTSCWRRSANRAALIAGEGRSGRSRLKCRGRS